MGEWSIRLHGIMTAETAKFRKTLVLIPIRIGLCLSPNTKLARVHSKFIHKVRGVLTRKGATVVSQPPSATSLELINTSGDNSVARQRALVGNSLNDEQRSDYLSSSLPH